MALFKIFKGLDADLSKNKPNTVEGYCYFTTDTGKMYVDIQNGANTAANSQYRVCLNAAKADVATKLGTAGVGSSTIPIYLSAGSPVACGNTLGVNITGKAAAATKDGNGNVISSTYLPLSGGSLNDGSTLTITKYNKARKLIFDGDSIDFDLREDTGGWAIALANLFDSTDTKHTLLGAMGTVDNGLTFLYMGGSYTDPQFKIDANGLATFKNIPNVGNIPVSLSNHTHNYLPLTGGTLTGWLKVGEKLELWTDSEGGNIRFTSPAGNRWSIDAIHNTALRFVWEETTSPFLFYHDGSFSASGALAIGGNITFNSIGDSGTSHGLVWNGSSDGADIYYRTDGADKGRLVFNLRDDDNTYICFAKNGADFANIDTAGYFSGSAYAAHLLKPTHNASTTSTWASDWTANVADHSGVKVWGQAFTNSTLPNDSGDIVLWLNNSTTLNMTIDGHFYQDCNKLVLDDNNYRNYALPITGGTMYGDIHMTQGYALHGYMGGGSDHWYLRGEGSDDNGYLSLTLSDNGDEFFDINFWHYDGYSTSTFRTTTAQTHIFNKLYVYSPNDNSIEMQVCNNYTNGVRLRADTEGGNINIYSGNGHTNFWEIDSYNGDLRFYTWRESDGNYSGAVRIGQESGCLYGAVWNDYAEYRNQQDIVEPGYCVASSDDGKVYKTTEMYQACDGIVSDTFGFAIGETEECVTPLAVAGRVLAYCHGDRYSYHAGDTVCAGPGGLVYKMSREEIKEWPDRIVGIVSEIPEYETWGTSNVEVNDRIWIKIK